MNIPIPILYGAAVSFVKTIQYYIYEGVQNLNAANAGFIISNFFVGPGWPIDKSGRVDL